ncbi:DUF2288 domain-containing protein [Leptolyngbya sp. FACHB-261]|uniref:DUF2288 domain-containing protein n=1 Tax=Leptolyngbya sp. FACHB-261 TaxID=2692806 RepID=UPI00168518F6|nr:DUF2288 domain-containing protein [Leptolyngbya sp. FACHB-261]MBD2105030.1 DUF2288 family protein [Leptolyngbya sp. FACHB-261]
MNDLKAQLTEQIDEAKWEWLLPHVARDALIVVTPGLDLAEVGFAMSCNQVELVQRWISEALIHKPSADQIRAWSQDRHQRFQALILAPYVLIRESPLA